MNKQTSFNKNISTFSLMMTGLTCILGSGWLLSTQKISVFAGPAGLISWTVGMLIALLVSLFFIEIGSSHPSAGGIGYYSRVTHGRFCGFLTAWVNWLSIVAVPPVEAQSIVQYLSQLSPKLNGWYDLTTANLTGTGMLMAILLMIVFMFVNYWSVQLFIRFNNFFSIIKILIPSLTIVALFYAGIHPGNFGLSNFHSFMPNGWSSIFTSIIACGVVMSFNGFQSPMTFSEEIKNPKKMLPIAVVGSILLAFVIYFLLQIVFIGSLNPSDLANGWGAVNFRSPYVQLLMMANFHMMALMLYIDAVISPGACGAAFTASSSRILYSLSNEKQLPGFLSVLNPEYRSPRNSIIACTLVGCIFLFLFKGWYQLVAVISILHVFSYIPAPIITIANRMRYPEHFNNKDQFKLPFANILAPFLLFVLSILLFYGKWPLTGEMALLIVPGLLIYFYYEYKHFNNTNLLSVMRGGSWLIMYFIGITTITYFGNNMSGENVMSTFTSFIFLAILSIVTFLHGISVSERDENVKIADLIESEDPT